MMKYRSFALMVMLCLVASVSASALGWHDQMVQDLMGRDNVEKSVVVERDQWTKRITKANYKFSFDKIHDSTRNFIRNTLLSHSNEATKFSTQGDDGTILMQVYETPGRFYSYKFYKSSNKDYTLLISVGGSSKPVSMMTGDKDFEQLEKDMIDLKVVTPSDMAKDFEIFSHTNSKTAGYLSDGQPTEFRIYGWVEKNHMSDTVCVSGEAGGQTLLRDSYGCQIVDPGTGAFRIYGWVEKTHTSDTVCVSGEPREQTMSRDSYGCPIDDSVTGAFKMEKSSDGVPVLVIDGEVTDIDELRINTSPNNKYGEKGKNGVVVLTTKRNVTQQDI